MLKNPRISEHAEAWGLGYVLAITNGKGNVVLMLKNPRISEHAEAWGLGYVLAITNGKGNVVLYLRLNYLRLNSNEVSHTCSYIW